MGSLHVGVSFSVSINPRTKIVTQNCRYIPIYLYHCAGKRDGVSCGFHPPRRGGWKILSRGLAILVEYDHLKDGKDRTKIDRNVKSASAVIYNKNEIALFPFFRYLKMHVSMGV